MSSRAKNVKFICTDLEGMDTFLKVVSSFLSSCYSYGKLADQPSVHELRAALSPAYAFVALALANLYRDTEIVVDDLYGLSVSLNVVSGFIQIHVNSKQRLQHSSWNIDIRPYDGNTLMMRELRKPRDSQLSKFILMEEFSLAL